MQFVVEKQDITKYRFVSSPDILLEDETLLVKIEKFAFTSNSISYGLGGNPPLNYFAFFPTVENYGSIPSWYVLIAMMKT